MNRDEIVTGAALAIRRGSKSFRAASKLFDRTTRERAWLLYCWCRHCDDVCDGQSYGFGPALRGNVSVLRGKTRQAVSGNPPAELPYQALALLVSECPIPECFIDDHLAGFALDEVGWEPASPGDLIEYCYHVAGAVGCMMAVLMGVSPEDAETLERAADLGIAFQLSNIARDIRDDQAIGRCYLPHEWLDEFGLAKADLFLPSNLPSVTAMAGRLVDTAIFYERSARRGVPKLPFRSQLAVLAALRIYGAIGRKVRAMGPAAWDQRVGISKSRKLAFLVPTFLEAASLSLR